MKKLAIVIGEPESINSEIIAKSWSKLDKISKKKIFLIGNYELLKKQLKIIKKKLPLEKIKNIKFLSNNNKLQIIDIPLKFKKPFSFKNNESRRYILNSLDLAHKLAFSKKILGFINCPINKRKVFKNSNQGVTEYLSKKHKKQNNEVMFLYNKDISVVPLTTHISLKYVSKKISKQLILTKVNILNKYYKKILKKKPKIAILGLNPHNSEFKSNSEEKKIIIPAIKILKKKINISGPFSADTIFLNTKYFDVIVGMYHDQILPSFKSLNNFKAINLTFGLNYLRGSPDHGTAEDLIKKNKANSQSLEECIKFILRKSNVKL